MGAGYNLIKKGEKEGKPHMKAFFPTTDIMAKTFPSWPNPSRHWAVKKNKKRLADSLTDSPANSPNPSLNPSLNHSLAHFPHLFLL